MRLFFVLLLLIPYEVFSASKIHHYELKNRMQIYVIENHRTPIVSHMVLYHVGGADDPRGESGLAHFLEHLMFRGTKENKGITSTIQKNGGNFNATTSSYYTNYFETIPKEKLELVMELEADRMRNLEITEDAVIAERKIVAEERKLRIDNIAEAELEEEMLSAFYRNNNAWQVAGWYDEIMSLNKEKATWLYNNFYYPNNAVLLVVGDTTIDEVIPLAEKYYGEISPLGKPITRVYLEEPEHKADISLTLRDDKVKQGQLKVWYRAPNILNTSALPLKLASIILGEGKASYLYKELVMKELVTHVSSEYNPFTQGDTIFEINVITSKNLEETKDKVVGLIDGFSMITKDDLERAKNMLKVSLIYNAESPAQQAAFYGNMIMAKTGLVKIESLEEEIAKVTLEEVNLVLKNMLRKKNKTIGYLLPKEYDNEK